MGRPRKETIDSFPHFCGVDVKLTALRSVFGNDAYAFYFILCEKVCCMAETELHITDPDALARAVMVPVERFNDMLAAALKLGLFSADVFEQTGVLTNSEMKNAAKKKDAKRARWRREKELSADKTPFSGTENHFSGTENHFSGTENHFSGTENPSEYSGTENPSDAVSSMSLLKDLSSLKDLNPKTTHTQNAPAHEEAAPKPFRYEGPLNVLQALNHYRITMRGFRKLDIIESFQGMMDDDLILAAIKESGGQHDSYCAKVLESWNRKGYRKLTDHPDYRPPPEGGEIVDLEIRRGRVESKRRYPGNATTNAFEEAGRRSRPGKQIYEPRE